MTRPLPSIHWPDSVESLIRASVARLLKAIFRYVSMVLRLSRLRDNYPRVI